MPRGRIFFLAITFFVSGFLFFTTSALAENSDHLVISQIQITGGTGKTANDFIEIYNPTGAAIDIKGYRLVKRTQTGATDTLIKSFTDSFYIPSQGYFLWANSDYLDIPILPNATTSATIASDNGIALRFGSNDTGAITDSVAWGEAQNTFIEGTVFQQNTDGGQALIRSNNQDTNNNATDFTIASSSPRHAEASAPPAETPTTPTPPPETPPPTPSPASSAGSAGYTNPIPCQNTILVNEIMINPEDSNADYEFVELYNQMNIEKDISGWILEDSQGKTTKFTLPANTKIAGRGFLTFYRPQTKITLNNSGDGVKLSNASGQICDASPYNSGAADEDISYSRKNASWVWTATATPNAANVFTEAKSGSADSSNQKNNDSSSSISTPLPITASSTIILNEFMPNPKGADEEKEFVELKNISATAVKLDKWRLEDSSRKKFIFSSSTIIGPHGFLTVWSKDSNISLNNSNDAIKLFNSGGQIADQINYNEPAEENFSYNRVFVSSALWKWSTVPSPGVENFISEPNHRPTIIFSVPNVAEIGEEIFFDASNSTDPEEDNLSFVWNFGDKTETVGVTSTHQYTRAGKFKITLTVNDYHANEVKEKAVMTIIDNGETPEDNANTDSAKQSKTTAKWLRVSGVVTVPPGLFGSQYFYVQDNAGRGFQIYMFKKDFPDLKVGDRVQTAGETSETQSGVRIKTKQKADIKILSDKGEAMPEELAIADIDDAGLGSLVKITGEVLEPKSGKFYVADDSGEILVELKSRAGFKGQIVKENDMVEITGILAASTGAYKIWPRFAGDIKILESKKEITNATSSANTPTNNFLSATVGGLGSLLLAYVARGRAALAKGLTIAAISKVAFWRKNKKDLDIS